MQTQAANHLEFSKRGNSVRIRYPGEKRSRWFSSKDAANDAITKLAKKEKINALEFREMRSKIIHAMNLPGNY